MGNKLILTIVGGVLVTLAASAVFAAEHIDVTGLIQPGRYQLVTRTKVTGMPAMSRQTEKLCVTEDEIAHFTEKLRNQSKKIDSHVRVEDVSLGGKHLYLKLAGDDGTINFDVFFDDPTHYRQKIITRMAGRHITMRSSAHRTGDCPPEQK